MVPSDAQNLLSGGTADAPVPVNPDEIQLDDFDELDEAHVPAPASEPEPEPVSAPVHNPDEILIEDEVDDSLGAPVPPQASASTSIPVPPQGSVVLGTEAAPSGEQSQSRHSTYFLALDKCLPRRPYMHVRIYSLFHAMIDCVNMN